MNFLRAYGRLLEKRPIMTKCFTSFVTFGSGDAMCQYFEVNYSGRNKYSFRRMITQATFGFIVSPYLHFHFSILLPYLFPSKAKYAVLKSLMYDQTVGASIFLILFFGYIDSMSGKSFNQFQDEIKIKFLPSLYANWSVWPAVMYINFSFVPIAWRVLYTNLVGMFWNAYLSYVQNNKTHQLINKV